MQDPRPTAGPPSVAVRRTRDAESPAYPAGRRGARAGRLGGVLSALKILDAAAKSGANAIHPGYGFLAKMPTSPRR